MGNDSMDRQGSDRKTTVFPFHTTPEADVLSTLRTSAKGLSSAESAARLAEFGPNDVSRIRRQPLIVQYLSHFKNLLVIILILAAAISIFAGDATSAIIIIVIVIASVTLDFFQEYKAGNAAELLRQKIITRASVLRDGEKEELPITVLVPGDVIILSAGDIVPADARVLSSKDLFVNQSALTGEPFPVGKAPGMEAPGSPLAEAGNYLFLGTSVVSGTATAVVTMTGLSTEFGHVAKSLVSRPPETEFERGLRHFSYLMTRIIFALVIVVFFINAFFRHGLLDSLLFSIALAVGMTPELLPMILSLNLSKGAIAMSEKGAIVRHPESIQNFGSMDVLCTDKTGTLTENQIALVRHLDTSGNDSESVLLYSYINSLFGTGLKSPLDEAVLRFRHLEIGNCTKIDEIPFDFIRKRVSVVVEKDGRPVIIGKGAPEEVLRVCTAEESGGSVRPLDAAARARIQKIYEDQSAQGFRALAVCYRNLAGPQAAFSVGDEKEMVLVGLVTFIDPPKESARESVQLLARSGIELKILTGDNELVTRKTCELIGVPVRGVLTGAEVENLDTEGLARVVDGITIFSRMTPVQKNRIMNALKKNGHVVGFMGDGINDAPSIREADVGISVANAVDIAKESADIILVENDLRILNDGVLEGRKTFGNTMKYILMGTSSNFGNMFSVAGASLFLKFLPMLPIQILLNNLLYDFSEATIPTDNVDEEYIGTPKKWDMGFIQKFIMIFGPISSVFDYLTFLILLLVFNADGALFQTSWFVESICTQTLIIFVIRTRVIPFWKSRPSRLLVASTLAIVIIACILPFTPVGALFGFVPPPPAFFAMLVVLVAGYIALVEVVKYWFYRRYGGPSLPPAHPQA
ncbi:magnesium-translocating P-type ATPase [Methanoregula sp.]|uniref:magnesium-translocating P-type ATPase n=1 Tax=Methanoregula sp. TaxID=2052170 RepID=UPI002D7F1268|nr:magnesium-translocating P-type ATPase [Methanoregula sp.]